MTIPFKQSTSSSISIGNSITGALTVNGSGDIKSNAIVVKGDAVFEGNIQWQGRDMRSWFESVESRLNILTPNPDLEKEWSKLAELRQQYVELERNIRAKQELFDILKKP